MAPWSVKLLTIQERLAAQEQLQKGLREWLRTGLNVQRS